MDWAGAWPDEAAAAVWIQGIADALGWGVLLSLLFLFPLIVLFSRAIRKRRFWCVQSRREVEVEFEERGLPGFRRAVAVRSCSVFDPPAAVRCRRRCLDADFRPQWEPGVSVLDRGGAYSGRPGER
jgi:hypothetical protein